MLHIFREKKCQQFLACPFNSSRVPCGPNAKRREDRRRYELREEDCGKKSELWTSVYLVCDLLHAYCRQDFGEDAGYYLFGIFVDTGAQNFADGLAENSRSDGSVAVSEVNPV